jgi:hypothetical protein
VLAAALALGAARADALTLADLAAGQSFTAGNGVTYGDFDVKLKRVGRSVDLAAYVVGVDADGFSVTRPGDGRSRRARGKIVLSYHASTAAGLLETLLSVDGGSAKKQLFVDGMKLGKLVANAKGASGPFDISGLRGIDLRDAIRLGAGSSVATRITAVPEPGTLALALGGVGALAALRRRRAGRSAGAAV